MTSVTTTWSPNCFQLRLAFNCRKSPPPPVLLRFRVQNLDCQIRAFSGDSGKNGNKPQWRRMANSSTNPNSSADDFSGWSATDEGEKKSSESPWNRLPGGIMGAGVAGLILVAGLAFAAVTIGKATSRPKLHMEPLTSQEELSVQNDDVEDEIKNTTIDRDEDSSSSHAQTDKTATNSGLLPENDEGYTSNSGEVSKNSSSNQDLNNESPIDDISNPASTSPELAESETEDPSDDNPNIETDISANEPLENLEDDNPTTINNNSSLDSTLILAAEIPEDPSKIEILVIPLDASVDNEIVNKAYVETLNSLSSKEEDNVVLMPEISSFEKDLNEAPISESVYPIQNGYDDEIVGSISYSDAMNNGKFSSSTSMPAPSAISPGLKEHPGKVLVPAIIDQVQGQALAALQVLKVIETDVQPGDLCTRREYARWLVSGSSALSRSSVSKVYPAMYIENVTELAFDDITSEDPDFPSIQGLAEAGLIYSKLSRRDMSSSLDEEQEDNTPLYFCPESPLSRQDLVSWKMSLEKRQLPVTDKKIMQEVSGFLDIDKIHPDALPALVADLSAGEQGIVALAFGYTRLFQPNKPVTKAQAAIALATGEAADIVSEELARIEAESMAEKAVAAHSALIDQVEKEVNTSFQDELLLEKEKIQAVQKLAEDAMIELEKLKAQREKENAILLKERATVDTEMELLSKLRSEVEEQLQSVMSNRVEISYEKERLIALRKNVETENQEISRLKYELEVERKALSMARGWAEDEAKRAREQAKVLEEARDRWESKGIKVIVDNDLQEEAITAESTWSNTQQYAPEETISRAETLVEKLKSMAADVKGKSRNVIEKIMEKVLYFIAAVKEWGSNIGKRAGDMKDSAASKFGQSFEDLKQSSTEFGSTVKEGAKRIADDCKGGVEKLTHKFKT